METDGNKRNKKGCFLDDFRFRLHIYIPHWARKHLALRQPERNRWQKSLPLRLQLLCHKRNQQSFFVEKRVARNPIWIFPVTYNLVWSRSVRIPTSSPQRSSTHVNTSFVRKEQSAGLKKKLKASNIIFDLDLNKFRNTTQLVCADKNVSSLSRYTKRQNLSQDLMSGNWDAAHEETHFELPFFRTSAIAIG